MCLAHLRKPSLSHCTQDLSHALHRRIVILLSDDPDLQMIAMSAKREGMMKGWCWVGTEFRLRTEGWLLVRPVCGLPLEDVETFATQVSEYTQLYFNRTISADEVDLTYSATLSDAIMVYAHAVEKVLSEGGDLSDSRAVIAAMRSKSFVGIGGRPVHLDKNGDRIESYEVMNYVAGTDGAMGSVPVGLYNSTDQQYTAMDRVVVWPGNTLEVPVDHLSGDP